MIDTLIVADVERMVSCLKGGSIDLPAVDSVALRHLPCGIVGCVLKACGIRQCSGSSLRP